jgi:sterol desaturase/sphingolipid hydroxylase (fatty acid hydroxylase superfamily)
MRQFQINILDHLFFHWISCLICFLIDLYLLDSQKWTKYKINNINIPDKIFNIFKVVIFNQLFVTFPLLYLVPDFTEGDFLIFENFYKIPLVIIMEEILFFSIHKILHIPFFYKNIHKIHHRWNHPVGISATYAHPLEHLFSNLLPIIISSKIAMLNYNTLRFFHISIIINTIIIAHSGFKNKFTEFHDLHHTKFNYNFGAIGLMDKIFKTDYNNR